MKKRLIGSILIAGILGGCLNDQKDRVDTTASHSPVSTSATEITYHPKEYREQIKDTILPRLNNLRVQIKQYPSMSKSKEHVYEYEGGKTERVYFREMAAEITISQIDSMFFQETILIESFPQIQDKAFLDKAVLTAVWFDSLDLATKQVIINCNICVPDTDWCYFYKIKIDTKGKKTVLLEEIT